MFLRVIRRCARETRRGVRARCASSAFDNARAPLEAFADGGLNLVEVSSVNARRLPCLDGGEDLKRICPPARRRRVVLSSPSAWSSRSTLAKAFEDCGFAIVQERIVDDGELFEVVHMAVALPGTKMSASRGAVFEVAKEPAHGVEGLGEMRAPAPIAASDAKRDNRRGRRGRPVRGQSRRYRCRWRQVPSLRERWPRRRWMIRR